MEYLILGIFSGATYALMAIGLVLIYSVLRAFQFAHGALVMLAAYSFVYGYQRTGSVVLALVLTILALALLSLVISRVAFEPLIGRHFPSLVAGLGFAIAIQETASIYFYSGQPVSFPGAVRLDGSLELLGASVDPNRLVAFCVAVACVIALDQLFQNTRAGMQMRAIADDPAGAQLCGVRLSRVIRVAFVVAGIAAAVAGVLLGMSLSTISPALGSSLIITALAAALLGGATSLRGAVAASLVIGISQALAIGYVSAAFSQVVAYAVILAILLVRPEGLFGRTEALRA